jgi:hypothetical protein
MAIIHKEVPLFDGVLYHMSFVDQKAYDDFKALHNRLHAKCDEVSENLPPHGFFQLLHMGGRPNNKCEQLMREWIEIGNEVYKSSHYLHPEWRRVWNSYELSMKLPLTNFYPSGYGEVDEDAEDDKEGDTTLSIPKGFISFGF